MTAIDRVLYNEPDNYLGHPLFIGCVDEIALQQASVHIEALDDSTAYLSLRVGPRLIEGRIRAAPTTRRQRRSMLAHTEERLRDHLRCLIPWPRHRTYWSVPVWRRPGAVVRDWCDARRRARAVLLIDIETDTDMGNM